MGDPIAAFKKQQQRAGISQGDDDGIDGKSEGELRRLNPRWSKIFTQMDDNGNGTLELEEVVEGFGKVVGAGAKVPKIHVEKIFEMFDTEKEGALNFVQFCKLSKAVKAYMVNNPKWEVQEEADQQVKRKEKEAEEKAKKEKEVPDVFELLGIKKSKEQVDFEAEKKKKAENHAASFVKALQSRGSASLESGPKQFAQKSKFSSKWGAAMGMRRSSAPPTLSDLKKLGPGYSTDVAPGEVDSPMKELRDAWESKTLGPSSAPKQKRLAMHKVIPLPRASQEANSSINAKACFSLRFSSDASKLAGVFFDGALRVYDVKNGTLQHALGIPASLGGTLKDDIKKEGEKKDGEPQMPDALPPMLVEGEAPPKPPEVSSIKKRDGLTCLSWRPKTENSFENSHIATGGTTGMVTLWDFTEPKPKIAHEIDTMGEICAISFTSDGNRLLATGSGRELRIYDVASSLQEVQVMSLSPIVFQEASQINGHTLKVVALAADPKQPDVFFTAGLDKGALGWDLRAGQFPVIRFEGPEVSGDAMSVSRNGEQLLCGSSRLDRQLEIFDLRMTGPEGTRVGNRGRDIEAVEHWDFNEMEDDLLLVGWKKGKLNSKVFGCCFDQTGRNVAAVGMHQNCARVFERANGPTKPVACVGTFNGGNDSFWSVAMGSTNYHDFAATGSADGTVSIIRVECR